MRDQKNNINLDIIIPYYENPNGLNDTLKSVVYPDLTNINVTVVDDCSPSSIDDIKEMYPTVNFLTMSQNGGPGAARQHGIDNTTGTYIMFIDTADYILSKYNLLEIRDTILNNDVPYMYLWRWLNAEHHTYSSDWNPLLHGWVFKREFLDLYNIRFSIEGSRSNEDFGFVQSCLLTLEQIKRKDKTKYFSFEETPVYMYVYDQESITHANEKLYMFTTHIRGLTINAKHLYDFCIRNNFDKPIIIQSMSEVMMRLYQDFLYCAYYKPEYLKDNWKHIRKFYLEIFKQFEKVAAPVLEALYLKRMPTLQKLKSPTIPTINFNKFINELNLYEEYPR